MDAMGPCHLVVPEMEFYSHRYHGSSHLSGNYPSNCYIRQFEFTFQADFTEEVHFADVINRATRPYMGRCV